jgi:hypothetical protein
MMGCTRKCWEASDCPLHGEPMNPFGRDPGLNAYDCCENSGKSNINPRHLWDEHDTTRWFTDLAGWNAHAAKCDREECEVY